MDATEGLGSIVIDELILPLRRLYLDKGLLMVQVRLQGPSRAVDSRGYTLFDRRGLTVFSSRNMHFTWPALPTGQEAVLTLELALEVVPTHSRRVRLHWGRRARNDG